MRGRFWLRLGALLVLALQGFCDAAPLFAPAHAQASPIRLAHDACACRRCSGPMACCCAVAQTPADSALLSAACDSPLELWLRSLAAILFPVFAQARDKARATSCLSNERQIGLAFTMHESDYDGFLPLTTFPVASNSWTDQTQPYIKNRQIYRCPSDDSANWSAPLPGATDLRRASYFLNAWMAGVQPFGNTSAINSPASVIYVAESAKSITRDHFHPFYWSTPAEQTSGFMQNLTWDAAKGETKELALRRHQEGGNFVFVDGHAKWHKWTQVWWQKPEPLVRQGSFDPRQ